MDEIASYNRERWNAIVAARSEYTRPFLEMTPQSAQEWVNSNHILQKAHFTSLVGKDVLCLAGGGGQQTAVFGLLGANVTVLDLSDGQLARDREAAAHHGYALRVEQGDMRDLARFATDSFDLVFQPYSINFVPDAAVVIREVSRVIRPYAVYRLDFANPFWSMEESDWTEKGYPVRQPYLTSTQLAYTDSTWDVSDEAGNVSFVPGPHEFVHTFSAVLNALASAGFVLFHFREQPLGDIQAEPGSWAHMNAIIPPFIEVGSLYRPDVLGAAA
jgi:SAM-dependent methyltransferase